MRGTLKRIEVERWGGEQARRYRAGSLNPSKTSTSAKELSGLASALPFSPRGDDFQAKVLRFLALILDSAVDDSGQCPLLKMR